MHAHVRFLSQLAGTSCIEPGTAARVKHLWKIEFCSQSVLPYIVWYHWYPGTLVQYFYYM